MTYMTCPKDHRKGAYKKNLYIITQAIISLQQFIV